MKTFIRLIALVIISTATPVFAQTNFTVTTPGGASGLFFNVGGFGTNHNPTLNLRAGNTYILNISTTPGFHPVDITTATSFPYLNNAYAGASTQNVSSVPITLTIPATNFPSTLFYICNQHGFSGQINVAPPLVPAAPPQNIILSIVLSPTNIIVKSTGTNTTYTLVPEFRSNLLSGSWLTVPSFTNTFASGTNTTSFGRLDAICGSNVFLRISQRPP